MSGHDIERAYVAAMLDHRAAQTADATASMRAEVDRLAESWRAGYDQQVAGHEDRMQAMRDETRAWIKNFVDGEATEPAPTQDVAGAEGATVPTGHRPRQPTPYEAELQRAHEIHDMDMRTYSQFRAELGVRSPTDMSHLFSQE